MASRGYVLIGFMGAGKTSVGGALSGLTGLPFIDVDERIETQAGRKIAEIFYDQGETAFRELEHKVLAAIALEPPSVVATGGGAVIRDDNWPLLRKIGRVVYLEASPEALFERVKNETHRPLLQQGKGREAFVKLWHERQALYAKADQRVGTEGHTPWEIASAILS